MLTLQSSKSQSVYLLIFKVNQDSLGNVILLASQGVSFTEVQERVGAFNSMILSRFYKKTLFFGDFNFWTRSIVVIPFKPQHPLH